MTNVEGLIAGAGGSGAGNEFARRWERLEDRGRALVAEASCKVEYWGFLGVDWLTSGSRWLAGAGEGGWEELVGTRPGERCYRRIAASPHLEAWLIFWPEGGRLKLHDHGGACGALTVVSGTLHECYLTGGCGPGRHRDLRAGQGVGFDGSYVHDVYNQQLAPASSVHVYSRAARSMRFYDLDGGFSRWAPALIDDASVVEQEISAGD